MRAAPALYDLENMYCFARAAIDVVKTDDQGEQLWMIMNQLWNRMVTAPIRSHGDVVIKLGMIREAFEKGEPFTGGAQQCLYQLANVAGLRSPEDYN